MPPFWIEPFDDDFAEVDVYPYIFCMDDSLERELTVSHYRDEFCNLATFGLEALFDSNYEAIKNNINHIRSNYIDSVRSIATCAIRIEL